MADIEKREGRFPDEGDQKRKPQCKAAFAACFLALTLTAKMPCFRDLDGDHTVETNLEELLDVARGRRWTDQQRETYRNSNPTQREYIKMPLKA